MTTNSSTASLTLLIQSAVADGILKQLIIIYSITDERSILLNIVSTISKDFLTSCDTTIVKLLLHGNKSRVTLTNTLILNASVDFIFTSKRFDGPFM